MRNVTDDMQFFESRHDSNVITLTKKTGAEGFFDDGLTYLFQKPNDQTGENELWPVRPGHIHFEVRSEFDDSMEFCDFRFYSVEKVEPPAEEATQE